MSSDHKKRVVINVGTQNHDQPSLLITVDRLVIGSQVADGSRLVVDLNAYQLIQTIQALDPVGVFGDHSRYLMRLWRDLSASTKRNIIKAWGEEPAKNPKERPAQLRRLEIAFFKGCRGLISSNSSQQEQSILPEVAAGAAAVAAPTTAASTNNTGNRQSGQGKKADRAATSNNDEAVRELLSIHAPAANSKKPGTLFWIAESGKAEMPADGTKSICRKEVYPGKYTVFTNLVYSSLHQRFTASKINKKKRNSGQVATAEDLDEIGKKLTLTKARPSVRATVSGIAGDIGYCLACFEQTKKPVAFKPKKK